MRGEGMENLVTLLVKFKGKETEVDVCRWLGVKTYSRVCGIEQDEET
jgi:hypothetical protein